jgi:hypothetical protein
MQGKSLALFGKPSRRSLSSSTNCRSTGLDIGIERLLEHYGVKSGAPTR